MQVATLSTDLKEKCLLRFPRRIFDKGLIFDGDTEHVHNVTQQAWTAEQNTKSRKNDCF